MFEVKLKHAQVMGKVTPDGNPITSEWQPIPKLTEEISHMVRMNEVEVRKNPGTQSGGTQPLEISVAAQKILDAAGITHKQIAGMGYSGKFSKPMAEEAVGKVKG